MNETIIIGVLCLLIREFQRNFRSDPEGSCGVPAEFINVDTDEEEFQVVYERKE